MLSLIPSSIQLIIGIVGPLLLTLWIYWKGYSKGQGSEQDKQQAAKDQLDKQINDAAIKNAQSEAERLQSIANLDKPLEPKDLIDAWNKQWGEGKDGHEDPK